ncbi:hypothetical protein FRC03_002783 [Tulasnella sp. 419]|nr:hypothetical protein FRC03_002783 [Tulasnella sp. 419]
MFQADAHLIIPAAVTFALIYGGSKLIKIGARDPHLPPGPPTIPILGNLHILPLKRAYLKFTEWARQYGSVYSLKVGPQNIVVVSSIESIYDIFEKNGAKTADRPRIPTYMRFSGESGLIAVARYGPLWRRLRKACVEVMKPVAREKQRLVHMAEISQLLSTLRKTQKIYSIIFRDIQHRLCSQLSAEQEFPELTPN